MDNQAVQQKMKRYTYRLLWSLFTFVVLCIGVWVSFAFWVQLPLNNVVKYIVITVWWLITLTLLGTLARYLKAIYLANKHLKATNLKTSTLAKNDLSDVHPQSNDIKNSQPQRNLCLLRCFYQSLFLYLFALLAVLIWWQTIKPQQNLKWAEDVSRILQVEQHGNKVALHNVRNFDWVTETKFTPRWETRQYDLNQLSSLDVITSYWMGPEIAHVLLSFGFDNGEYLTFSLETRREETESFSTIGGFFRKFELSLIAADERDVIYTRTNVRGEQVYLYRMDLDKKNIRRLFESYLDEANQLKDKPRFYNTLSSNCTTIVFDMARLIDPGLPVDYRIILSGYLPEYINDHHGFDPRIPFAQLKKRAFINPYAKEYAASGSMSSREYSAAIRQGILK